MTTTAVVFATSVWETTGLPLERISMSVSVRPRPYPPRRRVPFVPVLLGLPVVLTVLYVAGVPWVVTALDTFWEAVDYLGAHPRCLSVVSGLSWVLAGLIFCRLYRLYRWDQRVDTALQLLLRGAAAQRHRAWHRLVALTNTRGVSRRDRRWLASFLTAIEPQNPEEGHHHDPQQ